jgi:ActR/RegA family two-component response regulator
MSNMNASPLSVNIAAALLVSQDEATIQQLREAMQLLAMSLEVCVEVPTALVLLNRRKFDAVIVDLQQGGEANAVLEEVRRSPSNRTAVLFAVSDSDAATVSAFKAGSSFVLRRPLSLTSIGRHLKVAYGLILRERRRYFRCPVKIPVAIGRAGLPKVDGQTVNISESGMAISASVPLRPEVKVQVDFSLPGHESRFVVGATICWCKEGRLGLQFTSVSPRLTSELQEWLLHRLEASLPKSVADKFRNPETAPHGTNESRK